MERVHNKQSQTKHESFICAKCSGILIAYADADGLKKQAPKCYGISQHVKIEKEELKKMLPAKPKPVREGPKLPTMSVIFGTSMWAKAMDPKTNEKTHYIFPGKSLEIIFAGTFAKERARSQEQSENGQEQDTNARGILERKYGRVMDSDNSVLSPDNYFKLFDRVLQRMGKNVDTLSHDFAPRFYQASVKVGHAYVKTCKRLIGVVTGEREP